jgi:hypothetical protein
VHERQKFTRHVPEAALVMTITRERAGWTATVTRHGCEPSIAGPDDRPATAIARAAGADAGAEWVTELARAAEQRWAAEPGEAQAPGRPTG